MFMSGKLCWVLPPACSDFSMIDTWPTGQVKSDLLSNTKSRLLTDGYLIGFTYNLIIEKHIFYELGLGKESGGERDA